MSTSPLICGSAEYEQLIARRAVLLERSRLLRLAGEDALTAGERLALQDADKDAEKLDRAIRAARMPRRVPGDQATGRVSTDPR